MSRKILIIVAAAVLVALVAVLLIICLDGKTPQSGKPQEITDAPAQTTETVTDSAQENGPDDSASSETQQTAPDPAQQQKPTNTQDAPAEGVESWQETVTPTQPAITTPAVTTPANANTQTEPTAAPTVPDESQKLSYEDYLKLSRSQQQAFYRSFDRVDDFYSWLEAAQEEYEKEHPGVTGNGGVDIGDYIP